MLAICHCTHCQRQSGSIFSTNLVVQETNYVQHGAVKIYQDLGDSGLPVYRHFCENCGSSIVSKLDAAPGVVIVKAGTLDDYSGLVPAMEVYTDHAAGWLAPLAAQRFGQAAG